MNLTVIKNVGSPINLTVTTSEGDNINMTVFASTPPSVIDGFKMEIKGPGGDFYKLQAGDIVSGKVNDTLYVRYAYYNGGPLNDPLSFPEPNRLGQFNPQQLIP